MNLAIDRRQARVFRVLWVFLPEPSIARNLRFQYVMAARFLSGASNATLTYGAIIAIVAGGGSAFEAAITGTARLLPPALLGPLGGYLADVLPKRSAILVGYLVKAALCFVIPVWLGTSLPAIFTLVLLVNVVGQVTGPAESSLLPLVATPDQLTSATSLLSLMSGVGTGFGTGVLAPVLVALFGVRAVIVVTGLLYLVACTRVASFSIGEQMSRVPWAELRGHLRWGPALDWLNDNPAVASLIFVGAIADSASVSLQTLSPRYVSEVLALPAERSVYVFAPSAVGTLLALGLMPLCLRYLKERVSALVGVAIVGLALVSLGTIDHANVTFDAVNPIRLLGAVGVDLGKNVRTASFIALFVGFGLALTGGAVSVYINRRVPIAYQGRAFAIQGALKNGMAVMPLLILGAIASVLSLQLVVFLIPGFLVLTTYGLITASARLRGHSIPSRAEVHTSFWKEEPGHAELGAGRDAGGEPPAAV